MAKASVSEKVRVFLHIPKDIQDYRTAFNEMDFMFLWVRMTVHDQILPMTNESVTSG